jgi:hypothetical protein
MGDISNAGATAVDGFAVFAHAIHWTLDNWTHMTIGDIL